MKASCSFINYFVHVYNSAVDHCLLFKIQFDFRIITVYLHTTWYKVENTVNEKTY